jgi:hypothetical protein
MGEAVENVGHVLSLVSGMDYGPVFTKLRIEVDGPLVMHNDDWDVGYLRQRIEVWLCSTFWLLKKLSVDSIRVRLADASTENAEDTLALVSRLVEEMPALNLLSSNLQKATCQRWKVGPKLGQRVGNALTKAQGKVKTSASGVIGKEQARTTSGGGRASSARRATPQSVLGNKGVCSIFLQSELNLPGAEACHFGKECRFSHKLPTSKVGVLDAVETMRTVLLRKGTFFAVKDAVQKRFSGKK